MSQLIVTLNKLIKKFAIWLIIFVILYVYPSNFWQTLALGLLAITLGKIVRTALWLFLPRDLLTRLDEKAVLITGCDTGFGNRLAQNLDRKGVTVYAGCLFPEGEGATQLKNSCSSKLKILHLDVTRDDHVQDAVETVTSTLGDKGLWAVVNNAGIGGISEVEWMPVESCKKILEVNAVGPYRVSKAFLPLLRKSQGRIVIVASVLGRVVMPGIGAYSMSKYAAVALAEALRRELMKWNISVHTVEPWFYSTDITDEEQVTRYLQKNWLEADKNVKEDYGKGYILDYQVAYSFILNWGKRPARKVREVVDDMEHATVGKDPQNRYVPGFIGQLKTWEFLLAPVELQDIIYYFPFPRAVGQ